MVRLDRAANVTHHLEAFFSMSDDGIPQWKSWYRWPFLVAALGGVAMLVYGISECISLVHALRTLPATIEVNTAMSAFPPLGIGIIAFGVLAWMPRTADNRSVRPVRIGRRERDPAMIMIVIAMIGLLLYPVAGLTLRLVTVNMLTARGYTETIDRVRPTSTYITSNWKR